MTPLVSPCCRIGGLTVAIEAGVPEHILWMQSGHAQDKSGRRNVRLTDPDIFYAPSASEFADSPALPFRSFTPPLPPLPSPVFRFRHASCVLFSWPVGLTRGLSYTLCFTHRVTELSSLAMVGCCLDSLTSDTASSVSVLQSGLTPSWLGHDRTLRLALGPGRTVHASGPWHSRSPLGL